MSQMQVLGDQHHLGQDQCVHRRKAIGREPDMMLLEDYGLMNREESEPHEEIEKHEDQLFDLMHHFALHIMVMLPVGALFRGRSSIAHKLRIMSHLLPRSLA